jgi:outer membrane protein OmpA-like peptidoglycan-associated protein
MSDRTWILEMVAVVRSSFKPLAAATVMFLVGSTLASAAGRGPWLSCRKGPAVFQEDVEGSKDHPIVSRMPNSYITEYKKQFDAIELLADRGQKKTVEGEATVIRYFYTSPEQQPSALQVIRNYQNAVQSIGGRLVYERRPREGDGGETTLLVTKDGKETWIAVRPDIFSAPTQSYQLFIVERGAMVQEVTADQMYSALSTTGFIALYINFDFGKADLKPEGERTVDEIAKMLTANPGLKVRIEGHTDNIGSPAANKTLSEARAGRVMSALTRRGIEERRLSAAGFGSERPIADNRTEEGRGKNRRVELVKQE